MLHRAHCYRCLWALGSSTVFTYLVSPLHGIGFDAAEVASLLVFGVASAIGNLSGGMLADRFGPVPTSALALITMAASLILHRSR